MTIAAAVATAESATAAYSEPGLQESFCLNTSSAPSSRYREMNLPTKSLPKTRQMTKLSRIEANKITMLLCPAMFALKASVISRCRRKMGSEFLPKAVSSGSLRCGANAKTAIIAAVATIKKQILSRALEAVE